MKTDREILMEARSLLADPAKHTRRLFARDAERMSVDVHSGDAVCFCAMGAIARVGAFSVNGPEIDRLWAKMSAASQQLFNCSIVLANDGLHHADVLACFDKAIEAA